MESDIDKAIQVLKIADHNGATSEEGSKYELDYQALEQILKGLEEQTVYVIAIAGKTNKILVNF